MKLTLSVTITRDATFAGGDSVPGLIDREIEYERATGLPYIRGRVLKGLLVEECSNYFFGLQRGRLPGIDDSTWAAGWLFGRPGSTQEAAGRLSLRRASVHPSLRAAVATDIRNGKYTADDVLESLTAIRTQTANDTETGAPLSGSLRSQRVLLRGTQLWAPLSVNAHGLEAAQKQLLLTLLAVCARTLHRGGSVRNRGRGRLCVRVHDENDVPVCEGALDDLESRLLSQRSAA